MSGVAISVPTQPEIAVEVVDETVELSINYIEADPNFSHNDLNGRDASDAHPTSAITGLDGMLTSLANSIATKVSKAGDTMTGALALPFFALAIAGDPTATAEGNVSWDPTDHTLRVQSEIAGSALQVGQENWLRVVNKTGSTLTDGTVVYVSGAQGNRPTADLADASSTSDVADRTIGVTTADVANNAEGYVTTFGIVRGINTSAFATGDPLWVDPANPGEMTNVEPVAPDKTVRVGYALNSTVNGSIFVSPHAAARYHSEFLGLEGDDHPQYLTSARGDVRYDAVGAAAAAQAYAVQRANHTGTQTSSTISDFAAAALAATLSAYDPTGTAAGLMSAHVAAADPHTQYRLESVNVPWGEISGTPTTLSGYGITDAQPLDSVLSALAGTVFGASGQLLTSTGSDFAWSGSALTWTANQLAGSGGSAPGTQGATAWALGGGTVRTGTQVRCDGVGADSIVTAGGIAAPLATIGTQSGTNAVKATFVCDATTAAAPNHILIGIPNAAGNRSGAIFAAINGSGVNQGSVAGFAAQIVAGTAYPSIIGRLDIVAQNGASTATVATFAAADITLAAPITHTGTNTSSGSTAGRLAYFGGSSGDGAAFELRGSTYAANPNTGYLRVGSTYVGGWTSALLFTNAGISASIGASALLASERMLISGGGALPSVGATQVAISNGGIACGAAVSAAGGITAAGSSSGVLGATIRNTNSGTAASANVIVENDLGSACRLNFGVQSSGYTSSLFGVTAAKYTAIVTVGASTAGLMIGNASTGTPIIFGSANAEVARFTSGTLASGSLQIKYTGASALAVSGGATLAGTFVSTVSADSSHLCQVINQSSGTSALAGVEIQNNNGSNTRVRFQAYSSGLTATAFGITLGSYTSLVALGSNANGLIIGCQSIDKPIIFGINTTVAGRFESSATTNDTTLLLLDVTAGAVKRVSRGAADSGGAGYRVLRIPN